MAYFTSYYTNYFDVGAAVAAETRRVYGSGWGPSPEEWQAWLAKVNAAEIQRMAEYRADRENLRSLLLQQIAPPDEVKEEIEVRPHSERRIKPQFRKYQTTRPIFRRVVDVETRREIAQVAIKIRRLSAEIRRKRRNRKQEEAVLTLLYG